MSSYSLIELRRRVGAAAQAHQAAVDAFDEAAAVRLGVNRTDLRCLEILLTGTTTSPSGLGKELGLSTGSVTAMLDRLERAGHLTRAPDPRDRRRVVVRATADAAHAARELYGPIADEGLQEIAGYTAEELELLVDFLDRARRLYERHLVRIRRTPPAGRPGAGERALRAGPEAG
ncbi:MarR family transcriptional regulator [Actinoallomurus rhizosphaericola]|uniref:MarR family transcriptional regulator n=1 Tax=Actinoallomurus rhizosphaericola TaxID=2952536 RepID=UPI0020907534|nr:MarR family transcriptional regulator [Actinoallomurus rhizosphaericola]MCO5993487.1 MarR family transcriptional regulator [Actinoallomurus rhizosphaericola]